MTLDDKLEAHVDDAHVNTIPREQVQSTELRRRTAQALKPAHCLFGPLHDPFSEAVADWNIERPGQQTVAAFRTSLDTPQRRLPEGSRRHSLSHKPDVPNLRNLKLSTGSGRVEKVSAEMGFFRRSHDKERKLKEKPLPTVPSARIIQEDSAHERIVSGQSSRPQEGRNNDVRGVDRAGKADATDPHDSGYHSEPGREQDSLAKYSEQPADLTGIVDLTNTEDTDVAVTYAPAVTHETRYVQSHEIVQEQITREIHNHHVYHRVLPVIDFEVLPARHFIPAADGGLTEITEDQIPGGTLGYDLQRVIADAVSNMIPKQQYPTAPRQFTARKFEGTEGDFKEYVGSDGIKRTEQWWVHPPTLETDPTWSGQTRDFHFHSEQDGFRDPTLDGSSGRRHSSEEFLEMSGKQHFLPPRGASLGKTSIAGAGPTGHTVLPIRLAHGNGNDGSENPGVGVAF